MPKEEMIKVAEKPINNIKKKGGCLNKSVKNGQ